MTRGARALAVARVAAALCAFELLLARTSGSAQEASDVAWAALGWTALGAGAAAAAAWHARLAPLAAAGLTSVLALGIVVPPLYELGRGVELATGAAIVFVLAASAAALGRRALEPSLPLVASLLFVLGLWAFVDDDLAPLETIGAAVASAALVAAAARWTLGALAAAAAAAALASWSAPAPTPHWSAERPKRPGPDVIVLVVDTLRADHAEAMRAAARIGAAGATFTSARSVSSWTLPAMATLMTGLPLAEHAAWHPPDGAYTGIAGDVQTLAERFSENGWDTAAVVGPNAFTGSLFGFARGFDHFDHALDSQRHALPRGRANRIARPIAARVAMRLGLAGLPALYDADEVVRRALAVLDAHRRDHPLFLWLHFMDAHLPYEHADETDLPHDVALALETGYRSTLEDDPRWPTAEGRTALETAYANEVACVDRALERLLDALGPPPARGRLVVLTADHGEEFYEHGGLEHGHALWQEVLHVPLRIAGLGSARPGAVIDAPVDLLDVPSTLLAAAGLSVELPGRRLGPHPAPRVLDAQNLLYGDPHAWSRQVGRQKLIVVDGEAARYDLVADPEERRPRPHAPHFDGAEPTWPDRGSVAPIDAATRDLLRSLGYESDGR